MTSFIRAALCAAIALAWAPAAHAADFVTYTITTRGSGQFDSYSQQTGRLFRSEQVRDYGFAFTVPNDMSGEGFYVDDAPQSLPASFVELTVTATELIFSGSRFNDGFNFQLTTCRPELNVASVACGGIFSYSFRRFGVDNSYSGSVDRVWATAGTGLPSTGFGLAAAVPEPASWALMLTGFAMAGYALRRRHARVAVA